MADDVQVPPNSTGQIVKAIDIGGKVYQVVILSDGSGNVVGVTTNAMDTNPIDRALRDNGKVDIAAFDAELPAGTQNIGDVDVLTTPADGTDGAVHGASQKGFRALGTDGANDQQVAVDAAGNVQVDVVAEIPAGTQNIGDVDIASLPDEGQQNMAGSISVAIASDQDTVALAANQLADGHNVTVDNAVAGAAVNIQDGGNIITVDGTVTADAGTGPWPVTDNAGALTVDAANDSSLNVQIGDGVETALVTAAGALSVSIDGETAAVTVDQATAASLNAQVVGEIAHDTGDGTANPIKIGGKASLDEPTAVAVNDRVNAWLDPNGRLVTIGGHANPATPIAVNATASGVTEVIGTPGGGVSLHICKGSINNGGAAVLNAGLREAAGSNVAEWDLAPDGGGALFDFGDRGWKLTANTAMQVDLGAVGDCWINITEYYIAP